MESIDSPWTPFILFLSLFIFITKSMESRRSCGVPGITRGTEKYKKSYKSISHDPPELMAPPSGATSLLPSQHPPPPPSSTRDRHSNRATVRKGQGPGGWQHHPSKKVRLLFNKFYTQLT